MSWRSRCVPTHLPQEGEQSISWPPSPQPGLLPEAFVPSIPGLLCVHRAAAQHLRGLRGRKGEVQGDVVCVQPDEPAPAATTLC